MILTDEKLLRRLSDAVSTYDEGVEIGEELFEEVNKIGGPLSAAGLSAPQIGTLKRVFITWGSTGKTTEEGWNLYVNPVLEEVISDRRLFYEEGCLSFPGVTVNTNRNDEIIVSTIESDGERHRYLLHGKDAIVFQHELDHLDGIIFMDRVAKSVPSTENIGKKKVGRNDLCPCGSGLKYKRCHGK